MLMRTDPFPVFDRLTRQLFGGTRPAASMPLDAYRDGERFVVLFDLPGVSPESIDITVWQNVLTVTARRAPVAGGTRDGGTGHGDVESVVSERPAGTFSRRVFLADDLDTDRIEAGYDAGVLTLRIPVAAQAKPRRIAITAGEGTQKAISA
jgi:HSP20 family protein